ncbi:unnamed protein product [Vitrella brassicaformis CCMP3155]|uniref:TLDc domain-containing protein n=1 Tax=Vitrella brassicaformis (strain CCMP3155) TaxID=1169540 RepID=A0A0G4FJP4_VITBC|nr:unnamed protein product [Vitrella brassicaformis CCMP3155]|eukprot:CEM13914.1 unnamed protein product [Vitrella brassicaformis CCMP3155]
MASGSHADEAPIASPEPQHSPTREAPTGSTAVSASAGVLGLTDEQQDALRGWVDGRQLRLLYRASCDGSRYEDLLRCVGDAGPLLFVIRKDDYVFGGYMGDGLKLPEDPRGFDTYSCDLWHFSLAGHFDGPTKIKLLHTWEKRVTVAGPEGNPPLKCGGNVRLCIARLFLGTLSLAGGANDSPGDDVLSCRHWVDNRDVAAGYRGSRAEHGGADNDGKAYFGGKWRFQADDVHVLSLSQ